MSRTLAYFCPVAIAIAVVSSLSLGSAHANTFQIVGGTSFTLQSNFNPSGWTGNSTTGWTSPDGIYIGKTIAVFNSANASRGGLEVTGLGQTSLIYKFEGVEAAYTNYAQDAFSLTSPSFDNQTSHIGDSTSLNYDFTTSKLVPFLFDSSAYSGKKGIAVNGGPISRNVQLGFAVDPSDSSIAFAFLEDIAIHGDKDFDDMVVEIRDPAKTPIPAALPLFAGGLGVMGLFGLAEKAHREPNCGLLIALNDLELAIASNFSTQLTGHLEK